MPPTLPLLSLTVLQLQTSLVLSHSRSVLRTGRAWHRTPRWSDPWVRTLTALAREQQALAVALRDWHELYALTNAVLRAARHAEIDW